MSDLLLVIGAVDTGKSTLANSLDAEHICADAIRLILTGSPTNFTPLVWQVLRDTVLTALEAAPRVVVDATAGSQAFRELAVDFIENYSARVIRLECSEATFRTRERDRARIGRRCSLSDFEHGRDTCRLLPADLVLNTDKLSRASVRAHTNALMGW